MSNDEDEEDYESYDEDDNDENGLVLDGEYYDISELIDLADDLPFTLCKGVKARPCVWCIRRAVYRAIHSKAWSMDDPLAARTYKTPPAADGDRVCPRYLAAPHHMSGRSYLEEAAMQRSQRPQKPEDT